MLFRETRLPPACVLEPELIEDSRGFFTRVWDRKEFEERQLASSFVQANMSFNPKAGTLRGMHYQSIPHEEAKLIRCIRGSFYDVIIDLRADSSTYMQWFGIELTAENRLALYVPEGFAHGYQTLQDNSEAFYQVSEFYTPGAERGVRWDDRAFDIRWPEVGERTISEKDRSWPDFSQEASPLG